MKTKPESEKLLKTGKRDAFAASHDVLTDV
jgi:hypothetical protein